MGSFGTVGRGSAKASNTRHRLLAVCSTLGRDNGCVGKEVLQQQLHAVRCRGTGGGDAGTKGQQCTEADQVAIRQAAHRRHLRHSPSQ